jgi:putative protease
VRETDPKTGLTTVEQRNKFSVGDTIEIFGPRTPYYEEIIQEMYNEEGEPVQSAPHPQQILKIRFNRVPGENFIMRKKKNQ